MTPLTTTLFLFPRVVKCPMRSSLENTCLLIGNNFCRVICESVECQLQNQWLQKLNTQVPDGTSGDPSLHNWATMVDLITSGQPAIPQQLPQSTAKARSSQPEIIHLLPAPTWKNFRPLILICGPKEEASASAIMVRLIGFLAIIQRLAPQSPSSRRI